MSTLTQQAGASAQQQLEPYLRPQERLLWSGRPDPSVLFTGKDGFLIPFSLMWGGFAIVWEVAAIVGTKGSSRWFVLWGIPFVCVGLYMIFGRFILKRRRKRETAYGLTDRRALVAVGDRSLSDSPVTHIPTSVRRSRDGQHVTVTFGSQAGLNRVWANTGMDVLPWWNVNEVAFFDVAEPDQLLAALDRVRG
ncbi:MAG: hypothetical protein QOC77_173 [Thermoleophilaceae bacterium]|nr:hypothetical protein [Thermoleophilaceae bacterium]